MTEGTLNVYLREIDVQAANMIEAINVCAQTDSRNNFLETKQLMEYKARHHDDLLKTMTDEQKEIFEKLDDCWSEYASLAEKAIFAYAFRFEARLAMEMQTDTEE